MIQHYDINGFKILVEYYDAEDKLIELYERHSAWIKDYSDTGNLLEIKYYDKNHELTVPKDKTYCYFKAEYNTDGNITKSNYFDEYKSFMHHE